MRDKTFLNRILQFSLAGLLLLALWFAGSAAGYRSGFRSGYTAGQQQRESEEPYFAKYELYDKLPSDYDFTNPNYMEFEKIMMKFYQEAEPDSWAPMGGIGEIVVDQQTTAIAVFNEKRVHEKIEAILASMPNHRDMNAPSSSSAGGYSEEAYGGFGYGDKN